MDWNWLSFIVGVIFGLGVMWLAAVLAQVREADKDDREEHWR